MKSLSCSSSLSLVCSSVVLSPLSVIASENSYDFENLRHSSVPGQVFYSIKETVSNLFSSSTDSSSGAQSQKSFVPTHHSWRDCGKDEISDALPLIKWWNITTTPEIWSPGTNQLISKTFSYEVNANDPATAEEDKRVDEVRAEETAAMQQAIQDEAAVGGERKSAAQTAFDTLRAETIARLPVGEPEIGEAIDQAFANLLALLTGLAKKQDPPAKQALHSDDGQQPASGRHRWGASPADLGRSLKREGNPLRPRTKRRRNRSRRDRR